MKKKDDPKNQAIIWFFDYIFNDLDKLIDDEFSRIFFEAHHYFMRGGTSYKYPQEYNIPIKQREKIQSRTLPDNEIIEWRDKLNFVQKELKEFLLERLQYKGHSSSIPSTYAPNKIIKVEPQFGVLGGAMSMQHSHDYSQLKNVADIMSPTFLADLAKYRLCDLLAGIPRENIKKCPQCKKIFLQLYRKNKIYCNPKCTSRATAERERKKNSDEYNKDKARMMRDLYTRRKAEKEGKSIDEVTIRRYVKTGCYKKIKNPTEG
ncbi:hypothetical protein ACFL4G_08035 [Thermodesulfobacteriota bacterium]